MGHSQAHRQHRAPHPCTRAAVRPPTPLTGHASKGTTYHADTHRHLAPRGCVSAPRDRPFAPPELTMQTPTPMSLVFKSSHRSFCFNFRLLRLKSLALALQGGGAWGVADAQQAARAARAARWSRRTTDNREACHVPSLHQWGSMQANHIQERRPITYGARGEHAVNTLWYTSHACCLQVGPSSIIK